MSKEFIRFKWLSAKPIGSTTVTFQLEDGAIVEVKIDIGRAGVALDFKNPDGTPHYNIALQQSVTVIPPERIYLLPRDQIAVSPSQKGSSTEVYK
ncbi:MAG: hypothetical protein N3F06_01830 [Nitrososphaerales archaeon]|nr:hypothetical protein [Nitrososphaerales archaeon]